MGKEYIWGTGRRKSAIARVRLAAGSGRITINDKAFEQYFTKDTDRQTVLAPLKKTKTLTRFDVFARCNGGGVTGQAGAVVLGIARALEKVDHELHHTLREEGFLSRDPRMKERKKYGRRGARRGFQFSKR